MEEEKQLELVMQIRGMLDGFMLSDQLLGWMLFEIVRFHGGREATRITSYADTGYTLDDHSSGF
jgi:hypothetical protein